MIYLIPPPGTLAHTEMAYAVAEAIAVDPDDWAMDDGAQKALAIKAALPKAGRVLARLYAWEQEMRQGPP